jgi:regulator of sigma E protease
MELFFTGIVFVIIFSILVLIHELGHFFAARKSGIKVEEFGFGLPPRIWGIKKRGTLYSINWIPFGGFVRLLGEDASEEKILKDKHSFASKSPRARIFVVIAGVLMNLLLAFFLLTVGFTFGIQPLIVTGEEVLSSIDRGLIDIEQGLIVKDVQKDSPADKAGLKPRDRIISINNKRIISNASLKDLSLVPDGETASVEISRGGDKQMLLLVGEQGSVDAGFTIHDAIHLPRVVIRDVKQGSASEIAGLTGGDVILKVDDKAIYYVDEYNKLLYGADSLTYTIYRNGDIQNFLVDLPRDQLVVVSNVFEGSPAQEAGISDGDLLVAINGNSIKELRDVPKAVKPGENNVYEVNSNENIVSYNITPDDRGLIGVGLSVLMPHDNYHVSVFPSDQLTSILEIKNVVYPFWVAPVVAVEEMGRLSVLTAQMFVDVVRSLVTKFIVPEGVAGPVGIAQLTHVFVQEGFFSILRFMALLSLSLAIINILPFPALDGGRLFFILVEVIVGKKINPKMEAMIHALGFVLLMVLIFAVTYNDILRLF